MPQLDNARRVSGIAGQIMVTGIVAYPGEAPERVNFYGSVYGGPVVAEFPRLGQIRVSDPDRFGDFATQSDTWVRRFFGIDQ